MSMIDQIVPTLHVPSIEDTVAWYERVLGGKGHFDTFNRAGQCLFGSVILRENPFVGFCLARSIESSPSEECTHFSIWICVDDVDAVYGRVAEQGWRTETELKNKFWGERQFKLRDINGNRMVIAQQIEELGLEEIRQRHEEIQK